MSKEIAPFEGNLLEKAAQLNKLSEVSQVALGMCLVAIKEQELFRGLGYDSFPAYYQSELGRVKSDVSKLLTLGKKLLEAGFTEETAPSVGYSKLYVALSVFPDKDVTYAIAAAESNTIAEMLENRRDDALSADHECDWEPAKHCKTPECGKFTTRV